MQSFTDHQGETSLVCSECGIHFNSASLLLKHFANHISFSMKNACAEKYSAKSDIFVPKSAVPFNSDEDKKTESILERVLQQNVLNNLHVFDLDADESTMHDSSCSASEYCTSTSSDDVSNAEQSHQIPQTVIDMEEKIRDNSTSSTDINLVKCDLQKRLESCILKLSSKRDAKLEGNTELLKAQLSSETRRNELTRNHNDLEDFNPLKFCIVTMEEGEEKLELDLAKNQPEKTEKIDLLNCNRSSQSRKQQSPKKIQSFNEKAEAMMEALKIVGGNEKNAAAPCQAKKKYPCHVCWKVFGWSTDLKRHILTHTGERPFKCQQCAATFTRNFLLQKHEAKIHPLPVTVSAEASTTDQMDGVNELKKSSSPVRDELEESPTKRKRLVVQEWNKKQVMHNLGKKLQKLQNCHSIPYSMLSQTALNIS